MAATVAPVNADTLRLRHEFTDMPGLRLTLAQVSRLLGVPMSHAGDLVEELVLEGFLEADDAVPAQYGRPGIVRQPTDQPA